MSNRVSVPAGQLAYTLGKFPCSGTGIVWSMTETATAMNDRIIPLLSDVEGVLNIREMLAGVVDTEFTRENLERILSVPLKVEKWRVGEAIAEAYLVDHRGCCFPWPNRRDARSLNASLPGADIVGFTSDVDGSCFAFGEVKTSSERRYPPRVMYGFSGLQNQLKHLRDRETDRDALVKYLLFRVNLHANMTAWRGMLKAACRRYLKNSSDVQLYGVLVRDVKVRPEDLIRSVDAIASDCSEGAEIEFLAIYLPENSIEGIDSVAEHRQHRSAECR